MIQLETKVGIDYKKDDSKDSSFSKSVIIIAISIVILTAIGFLYIWIASCFEDSLWPYYYERHIINQIVYIVVGLVGMLHISFIPRKYVPRLGVCIFALSLIAVSFIIFNYDSIFVYKRYLWLGDISFIPGFFFLFGYLFALAFIVDFIKKKYSDDTKYLLIAIWGTGVFVAIVSYLAGHDLRLAFSALFIAYWVGGFTTGTLKKHILVFVISVAVVWGVLYIIKHSGVVVPNQRIEDFIRPDENYYGLGYYVVVLKNLVNEGGMFGRGFCAFQQFCEEVPEITVSNMLGVLVVDWGILGIMIIMGLYYAIVRFIYKLYLGCKGLFESVYLIGLAAQLTLYFGSQFLRLFGFIPAICIYAPFLTNSDIGMIIPLEIGFAFAMCKPDKKKVEVTDSKVIDSNK